MVSLTENIDKIVFTLLRNTAEKMVFTCNNKDVGNPTILLLPITTAFLPIISTPDLINNSMQPFGVHGINSGSLPLMARFPIFSGWKPSTSFSKLTASKIFPSSKCCTHKSIGLRQNIKFISEYLRDISSSLFFLMNINS